MDNSENTFETITPKNTVKFYGKGSQLFAIDLLNAVLTIITLGLYYPWAKAKKLKYVYQNTALADSRFDFLGTGKEIFRGFIKALLILAVFYVLLYSLEFFLPQMQENEILLAVFIIAVLLLVFVGFPFFMAYAMYGTFRYRAARSSWRGILCGFDANKKEFISTYLKGYYFFTLAYGSIIGIIIGAAFMLESYGQDTYIDMAHPLLMALIIPLMFFAVYASSWFQTKLYSITYGNLRLGNLKLNFYGKVSNLFGIQLLGAMLSSLTFGIYYFWLKKNLYNFLIENLKVEQDGNEYAVKSTISGGQVFRLEVGNILLLIFTLGLGYSWTYCRTANFITRNLIMPEEIDLNRIEQTEKTYTDATGEGLSDMMDMGGIFF